LSTEENNFNLRILFPAKLLFKIEGRLKIFHDKQKLKQHITTKPALQKILKAMKGWKLLNLKRSAGN
jgi:hypothetical protein